MPAAMAAVFVLLCDVIFQKRREMLCDWSDVIGNLRKVCFGPSRNLWREHLNFINILFRILCYISFLNLGGGVASLVSRFLFSFWLDAYLNKM